MRRFASLTTSNLRFARRYDEAIQASSNKPKVLVWTASFLAVTQSGRWAQNEKE